MTRTANLPADGWLADATIIRTDEAGHVSMTWTPADAQFALVTRAVMEEVVKMHNELIDLRAQKEEKDG